MHLHFSQLWQPICCKSELTNSLTLFFLLLYDCNIWCHYIEHSSGEHVPPQRRGVRGRAGYIRGYTLRTFLLQAEISYTPVDKYLVVAHCTEWNTKSFMLKLLHKIEYKIIHTQVIAQNGTLWFTCIWSGPAVSRPDQLAALIRDGSFQINVFAKVQTTLQIQQPKLLQLYEYSSRLYR